jgi:hypothetical protein
MYRKVYYPKKSSLLILHVFVLPDRLTRVFTRSSNSLPDFLPRFLPEIVPDFLPESLPGTLPSHYSSRHRSFTRVLPRHVPDRVNPTLLERLPSWVKSYLIMYPALLKAYPTGELFTRSQTRPYPILLPGRVWFC